MKCQNIVDTKLEQCKWFVRFKRMLSVSKATQTLTFFPQTKPKLKFSKLRILYFALMRSIWTILICKSELYFQDKSKLTWLHHEWIQKLKQVPQLHHKWHTNMIGLYNKWVGKKIWSIIHAYSESEILILSLAYSE